MDLISRQAGRMTAEEAIATLKANYPDACYEQLREAVDTAISALEQTQWIPVSKKLPEEEHDTIFAKYWGTDRWNKCMFRKRSDLVEVTVELEDGTRYTDASRTRDGEWDIETNHGAVKKKVVAWHYMSEPWEGEQG